MSGWRLTTGHDPVTQLDDLGDADDALRVVALIRQQHQEAEDVRNQHLRAPATHANNLLLPLLCA